MSRVRTFTSGRVLARNAAWNLVGMAAPMLVALVSIPLLIEGMGKERFGLLAIVWMGVGYFSLFDLGLGRALTKLVAERLGNDLQADLGSLIWTAFILLALFGSLGAILLCVFSSALVISLLQVPPELREEAIAAFRILAIGIPFVIITAGIVGLLEAHQRFKTIAAVRVPLGIVTFAGPLATLQFTPSIAWATVTLLVARLVALSVFYITAARVRSELRSPELLAPNQVRSLLSFGGWLTVTNIIGPLMTYLDRFFISAMLGLVAVTHYITPYEVLSRLQILPQAVMGVLFPAMATAYGGDQKHLVNLFTQAGKVIYWVMLPITAGVFLLAPEALQIWLGEVFREASTPVVYWLAMGWIINTLARPAFTILQSTGRPDLVAKAHLTELIPYLGLLWWLAVTYGISGVAAAWTLRIIADTLILNLLAAYQLPFLREQILRTCWVLLATVTVFGTLWLIEPLALRVMVLIAITATAGLKLWPIVRLTIQRNLPVQRVT